ncbi:GNAT family N-acetyltransferase [Haloferula chungangensis]|uniref:GNAT family N-acetyltransferase n=1 Tax=Haloferula chungangensis TaxID=1048331 RepID=A0ABW2L5I4_9BACT
MSVEVLRVSGEALMDALDEVARLRIEVFREYPYLYDGTKEAEREYLEGYAESSGAVLVLARVDGVVIGASTGMPMGEADEAFQQPFLQNTERLENWFYLGESVLSGRFRGQGIGHRFFDEREAHARELAFPSVAFCSVVRPQDHPLKPHGYRSHERFWTKRGYEKRPEWRASLNWKQIDSGGMDVRNELEFWTRNF